ncbi:MAG: hypothetical protein JW712_09890 [Dehalococcoidales bacterium]|nr:hypothetical protein [Dehalococcoidales bacterium]
MVKPKNLVVKKLIPIIITGLTLTFFFGASPVKADGGIAMSGSFYQQAFEIPQGAYASGPDIYIVVFNNGEKDFQVNMITDAPPGVELELSPDEFSLQGEGL